MPLEVNLPDGGIIRFEMTKEYHERGWVDFEASVELTLDAFRERATFRYDDAIIKEARVARHLNAIGEGRIIPAAALQMFTSRATSLDFEDYVEVFAIAVHLDAQSFLACCPADQLGAIRERIGVAGDP